MYRLRKVYSTTDVRFRKWVVGMLRYMPLVSVVALTCFAGVSVGMEPADYDYYWDWGDFTEVIPAASPDAPHPLLDAPAKKKRETKYGEGIEAAHGQKYLGYNFKETISYARVMAIEPSGIIAGMLFQIVSRCAEVEIERRRERGEVPIVKVPRMARRVVPAAYKWLNENWGWVESIFDEVCHDVVRNYDAKKSTPRLPPASRSDAEGAQTTEPPPVQRTTDDQSGQRSDTADSCFDFEDLTFL
jgi:hypothetical protein